MVFETESTFDFVYLKWPRNLMKCVGLWSFSSETPLLRAANTIHSYLVLVTCGYFAGSFVVGLKNLGDVDDAAGAQHIAFVIYYLLILWKMLLCKTRAMKRIIEDIKDYEAWIRKQDESLISIFKDNLRYNKKVYLITIMCLVVLLVSYLMGSMADISTWKNEDFVPPKQLALPEWFPFSVNKNYKIAYIYQIVNACFIVTYGMVCDVFFLALIIFPVIQLRILGHQLEHFQDYCQKKKKNPVAMLKELEEQHENIIRLVGELNAVCQWLFCGDFCLKTYHISTILFQLQRMDEIDAAFVFTLSCLVTLFLQVFNNYYHANELILESNNIGTRIYMSSWYGEQPAIQRSLYFMMMRTQKPLVLVIANLDFISNILLMKIFKASYTYLVMAHF